MTASHLGPITRARACAGDSTNRSDRIGNLETEPQLETGSHAWRSAFQSGNDRTEVWSDTGPDDGTHHSCPYRYQVQRHPWSRLVISDCR